MNTVLAILDNLFDKNDVILIRGYHEYLDKLIQLSNKLDLVIGIQSLMTTQIPFLIESGFLGRLKKIATKRNVFLIVGGPHALGDPVGSVLSLPYHVAVIGESEVIIPSLLNAILNSNIDGLFEIKGLTLKFNGDVYFTGFSRRIKCLDASIPFPYWRGIVGPIEISRGCPWGCKYCQVTFTHGASMRHRSIESIKFYIEKLIEFNALDLRFISPNALSYGGCGSKLCMDALSKLIDMLFYFKIEHGARIFIGTFPSEVRPDFICNDTAKMLRKVASNKRVIIGVQTASPRLLKELNRGHTIEDVEEAVRILNEFNFQVDLDFIFNLPGEEIDDVNETFRFIEEITSKYRVKIHAHTFIPLPGSPYARERPKRMSRELRHRLYKLIGEQRLYGQWERQEDLALRIHELRMRRVILDLKFMLENMIRDGSVFKITI